MALKVSSTSATVAGAFSFNPATNTVTFTPSAALSYSTGYTMIVSTGAKDLAGNALAAPVFISFTTMAQPDLTPPSVTASNPANGATNVAVSSTVTVTFSEDVQSSTVNSGTFKLSSGGSDVAASVAYDPGSRTSTLTPSAPLANSQTYTVTVTTGVKDLAGNSLSANYVSTFTTVASSGGYNIGGEPHFAGTTATDQIHVHITFVQTGTTLSLATNCESYLCSMIPLNQAGADIVGPLTPGTTWATIVNISGSLIGSAVTFTITLDNGRTFNYSGTASSSDAFTGTLSGATQPPVSLPMARSQ
jgi:hypothetical protein